MPGTGFTPLAGDSPPLDCRDWRDAWDVNLGRVSTKMDANTDARGREWGRESARPASVVWGVGRADVRDVDARPWTCGDVRDVKSGRE